MQSLGKFNRLQKDVENLVNELNRDKEFKLNIKSFGITSFFFEKNSQFIRMTPFSYETEKFFKINRYFTNPEKSILSAKDFILGLTQSELTIDNENYNIKNIPNNEINNFIQPETFLFNIKEHLDYDNINSFENLHPEIFDTDFKNKFNDWKSYINDKSESDCYILKQTVHYTVDEDTFLGVTVFLISEGRSGTKKDLAKLKLKLRNYYLNKLKYDFAIFGFISYKKDFRLKERDLLDKSLQSSIVSVLSRNGSHNIGSHVLNKLSDPELINKFLKTNKRGKLKKFKGENYKGFWNENSMIKSKNCPKELIRVFNKYLKERMDFIADVATSTRAVIQNPKRLKSEIFEGINSNLLLLEHISGKGKEFEYQFKFITEDGKEQTKDPLVSMPNDILGQQAFYIIIENVIRNTAKHSGGKNNARVTFYIQIKDTKKEFFEISIFDDIGGNLYELVNKRNKSIDAPILDINNTIRSSGWGTIEMKLAAAYLSRVDITDIPNEEYKTSNSSKVNFPLIEAKSFEIPKGKNGFGYTFYLKKPKEVLIVDYSENQELKSVKNRKLKEFGIDILFNNKKTKELIGLDAVDDDAVKNRDIFPHQFLIVHYGEKTNYENSYFEVSRKLSEIGNTPQRVIVSLNKKLFYLNFNDKKLTENPHEIDLVSLLNDTKKTVSDYKNELWYSLNRSKLNSSHSIYYSGSQEEPIYGSRGGATKHYFDWHGKMDLDDYVYYEPFGSSTILGLWFDNYKAKALTEDYLSSTLVEAIYTKVIIIDERIQDVLTSFGFTPEKKNKKVKPIEFSKIFKKTNVLVPNKETDVNLKSINLKAQKNKLFKYLKDNINEAEFLVIHFGIIESIRGENEDVVKVIKQLKAYIKEVNPYFKLILTSGRGVTDDIPKEEYFINFSALYQYTIDINNRSKLHLISLLKSVRKKKNQL